jgi:Flp pilus assembly pilin Flp
VSPCHRAHAQDGATSVEYGLIAFAIGIGLVIAGPVLAEAFLDLLNFIMEALLDRPLYTRS